MKKYVTEYQMRVDDPMAEKCIESIEKLHASLVEKLGYENVVSCGLGLNAARTGPGIKVYLVSDACSADIPSTFDGFEVESIATGRINPA